MTPPPEGDERHVDANGADPEEVESAFPLDELFAPESTEGSAATEGASMAPTVVSEAGRPSTLDVLRESQEIDHYRLLGELGRGGMGVVYAAQDTKLGRKVAIKVLLSRGHAGLQRRLMREAMALAKLSHPNVIPVYEVREREDATFLVMEYVEGLTLRAWLETERSLDAILDTFIAAARGLIAAHDKGLIHRDFKPDNVMIGTDGRVRVMDFGLARASNEGEDEDAAIDPAEAGTQVDLEAFTRTGALLGTPAYMSPEQLRGQPASAASDQFAVCIALYEAVYGHRPFAAKTLSELCEVVGRGTLVEVDASSGVPAWLHAVLLRGLAPEPGDRFASMRELAEALEAGEPIHEGVLAKFWDRKIPHVLGAYAAGGAAGIEIFNQISARFGVRAAVGDALLIGAAALVPSIVAVLWIQGEAGRAVWSRGMKLVVGANLVAALALALPFAREDPAAAASARVGDGLAGDEERGPSHATTTMSEVVGETGDPGPGPSAASIELPALTEVASRLPCALMFPLAGSLSEAERRLRTGVLVAVEEPLSDTELPALERGWQGEALGRLEELRVPAGQPVPTALMFEQMHKQGCDQILHGRLSWAGAGGAGAGDESAGQGQLRLELELQREGQPARELGVEAPLLEAIDEASAWLAGELGPGGLAAPSFKPVAEGFTTNEAALHDYFGVVDPFESDPARKLALADHAVELDSSFALASFAAAMYAKRLLSNEEALRRFRRALDHRYRFTELRRIEVEAEYFAFTGSPEQGEAVILEALEREPANIELLTRLARIRHGRSNLEGAVAAYERIVELEPDNVAGLTALCAVYPKVWRFDALEQPGRKLVELRPDEPRGYTCLTAGLAALGEIEEARKVIREGLRLDPTNASIRTTLAAVEIAHGEPDEGLKIHAEALAELKLRAGDGDQARAEYLKLLDKHLSYLMTFARFDEALALVEPELDWLIDDSGWSAQTIFSHLNLVVSIYGMAGEPEAGYALLDRIDPGPAQMTRFSWLGQRVLVALHAHDHAEAERLSASFTALADEAPELREAIETDIEPLILVAQEDWQGFVAHYETLVEAKRSGYLDALVTWAYEELERYEELDAKIAPLLILDHNSPHLLYFRAQILRSRGEHEAARAELDRALELYAGGDPGFRFYAKALALAASYE